MNIDPANPSDLNSLHALAASALTRDSFSIEQIAEKLFRNPCPQRFTYQTWIARDGDQVVGMMQMVHRPEDHRGWLGLFAVAGEFWRRGVATALWRHVEANFRDAGVTEVEALAIPGNYLLPGLDPGYTEGLCFLESQGFERFRDCANLIGVLDRPFDTRSDEDRLKSGGVTIRRAEVADDALLDAYFSEHFGLDWRMEVALALDNEPPGLHLALAGNRIIAFSAHSTQNREHGFFGPMGTAPEARGKGIGRVLLWRCLNDLRDAGHKTAVIPWVGPISFYFRHAGCRVDRVFWRYRKQLT